MTPTDLHRLCAQVADFGVLHDWRFKARPTIVWEFATLSDFAGAQFALERCILEMCPYLTSRQITRSPHPGMMELDCHGVTFRLVCDQITMTPDGPFGAAEIAPKMEHFDWDAFQKLRKSGSY
jgi:hypothetical protein